MSKSLIIAIISIASLSYLLVGLYLYFFQERIIFRNDLAPTDIPLPPEAQRLDVEGIEVGWIDRGSATTLFYFGGNADNALEFLWLARELGPNIVAMNYPGYGNSKGRPGQKQLYEAALKVFDHYKSEHNVVVGRSLGTAVASYLAAKRPLARLILITPFYSITHLAKLRYPIYPVSLLLRHPFEQYRYLQNSSTPVCLILAQHDRITPPSTIAKLLPHIPHLIHSSTIPATNHADILTHPQTIETIKKCLP